MSSSRSRSPSRRRSMSPRASKDAPGVEIVGLYPSMDDLLRLKRTDLREIAKQRSIPKWYTMNKDDLINALSMGSGKYMGGSGSKIGQGYSSPRSRSRSPSKRVGCGSSPCVKKMYGHGKY